MTALTATFRNVDDVTLQRFRQIVNLPPSFDSPVEEVNCHAVVEALTDDQIQQVAKISYAYWILSKLEDPAIQDPSVAKRAASKIARWHVQYLGGTKNTTKVVHRLKEAVELRKKHNMDLLRTCFDEDQNSEEAVSLREDITEDMGKQLQFLRGQDKLGRAVLIKIPRTASGTSEQAYIRQQLYVAERSAAVTEFMSLGKQDSVCAIFSMENQDSSKTPPLSWQYHTITLLQQLFPGRIGKVLILEAPFMIRQIFGAIKPMVRSNKIFCRFDSNNAGSSIMRH